MTLPDGCGEAGIIVQGLPRFINRQWHHKKLYVGPAIFSIFRACAGTRLAGADGQTPGPVLQPFKAMKSHFQRIAAVLVQRQAITHLHDGPHLVVVLKILSHLTGIMDNRDAVLAQQRRRANARQLQYLR